MRASGRKSERAARRYPEQAAGRVEEIEERVEVAFVRSAAVEERENALGVARRRAGQVGQVVDQGSSRQESGRPGSLSEYVAYASSPELVSVATLAP